MTAKVIYIRHRLPIVDPDARLVERVNRSQRKYRWAVMCCIANRLVVLRGHTSYGAIEHYWAWAIGEPWRTAHDAVSDGWLDEGGIIDYGRIKELAVPLERVGW